MRLLISVMIILLLAGTLSVVRIDSVWAEGPIYIRPDGSIDPPDAPISTADKVTYSLTDNITGVVPQHSSAITVERDGIVVDGAGYTVEGTTVYGSKGINLSGRKNVTVRNIQIRKFYYGFWLYDSSNDTISGSNITLNSNCGIRLAGAYNNSLIGNRITNNYDGLRLLASSNNLLRSNSLADNEHNFGVEGAHVSQYVNDVDVSNTVNGKPMYYFITQKDLLVSPVTCPSIGYLALVNSTNVTVEGLDLRDNFQGILFAYTTYSQITTNNLEDCEHGIHFYRSNHNNVSGNNMTSSYSGIYLHYSSNNISSNNMANNTYGIWLLSSSGNNVSENNMVGNSRGVDLYSSSYNSFSRNSITDNDCGIMTRWSSANNTLYHNNIIGNVQQAEIYNSDCANIWDDGYPSGGNYWSDYVGTDTFGGQYQNKTGSDGRGDFPYLIDDYNKDGFPLMQPFPANDTAVTSVAASKSSVGQGYNNTVNVTVANLGNYQVTFNVSLSVEPVDLVGSWRFDEGTGTKAYDCSGNDNEGLLLNGPLWVGGKKGKALRFDGFDDYVLISDPESLDIETGVSVAAWIYLEDAPEYASILTRWYDGTEPDRGIAFQIMQGSYVRFGVIDDANLFDAPFPFATHTWYHVAATWNGSTSTVYVNGVEIGTRNTSGTFTNQNVDMGLGVDIYPLANYFPGRLDEIKMYNRALSPAQVWNEYSNTRADVSTQTVTLGAGASANIFFSWNTSEYVKGNYTVGAYAWPVDSETQVLDNRFIDGWVFISITGDVNADRKVDLKDVFAVGKGFGSIRGPDGLCWHSPARSCCPHSPNCDIDGDGKIDLKDYYATCKNYGKSW